ncbi:MAG: ATP-binding protein, partial [Chloroflexi bacterium]|nr:ATP-binding protein [Chloroflexota bacterium]
TVEASFDLLEYRIADIGVFSDPSDLRLAPVSVTVLVQGALRQVSILQRRSDHPIVLDVPKGMPAVMVDSESITRAMAHVIDNAIKFGNSQTVKIYTRESSEGIEMVVEDQGDGIPDGLMPHLFTPLLQGDGSTTRRHSGLGIGLALVKMILDAHEIAIDIQTRPQEGTTVAFEMPYAKLAEPMTSQTAAED